MKKTIKRGKTSVGKVVLIILLSFFLFMVFTGLIIYNMVIKMTNKSDYSHTESLCDGWWIEYYNGINLKFPPIKMESIYLTDSSGVNKFIGMNTNQINNRLKCTEENIIVITTTMGYMTNKEHKTIFKKENLKGVSPTK